jgi:hypothetical protein
MTEEKLKVAAYKLCELRGINPEHIVTHSADPEDEGYSPSLLIHTPVWQLMAQNLEQLSQALEALRSVEN